jgi:hypothetical protein
MQEKWTKLVYPNLPDNLNRFEVSTYGRLKNSITQHIYKQDVLSSGYCSVRVTLGSRKNKMHILIHKAVAYTFLNNDNNYPEVNHKDGNKTNNYANNLEWCTSHDNQQHKYDNGLFDTDKIKGENNGASKLTWDDVKYIRQNYIKGSRKFGAHAMAQKFSVSHPTILSIIKNATWVSQDDVDQEVA